MAMETIERVGNPSVAPFGDVDPRDVVYVAAVSCARCGEVNNLVPASAMFLCAWCATTGEGPSVGSTLVRTTPVGRGARCDARAQEARVGIAIEVEGGTNVKIEYVHASVHGNGAMVAEEFQQDMTSRGVAVAVHHIHDVKPKELPPADLYLFSSPGRMGKPIRGMRRFLKDVRLPAGTRYAVLTTEMAPQPDKKTGRMPTEEEICRFQRVRPIMRELLQAKGLIEVAEDKVYVTGIEGPLEEGWQKKVEAFAAQLPSS